MTIGEFLRAQLDMGEEISFFVCRHDWANTSNGYCLSSDLNMAQLLENYENAVFSKWTVCSGGYDDNPSIGFLIP